MQRNASVQSILKELYHEIKSLLDRFPYKLLTLVCCLLFLSIICWLLVQESLGSQTPTLLQTLTHNLVHLPRGVLSLAIYMLWYTTSPVLW